MIWIDPKLANHVDAAQAAGFTVYALPGDQRPAGFVAVCLTEDGPWAHIQKPTHNWDDVELDVPIKPHKEYGSAVHVDHDGSPKSAVVALTKACTEPMVTVRFLRRKRGDYSPAPKVANFGRKCIERWPGGAQFEKLGERGTGWNSRTQAGRLDVGDRFVADLPDGRMFGVLTVKERRYRGDLIIITTEELEGHTVEINQSQLVTLAGAS